MRWYTYIIWKKLNTNERTKKIPKGLFFFRLLVWVRMMLVFYMTDKVDDVNDNGMKTSAHKNSVHDDFLCGKMF